jgi:hypothetical protein
MYDRGNSGIPGERERECKGEKNNGEIEMWERGENSGIGRKERKEGAECAMRRERQSNTRGMDATK